MRLLFSPICQCIGQITQLDITALYIFAVGVDLSLERASTVSREKNEASLIFPASKVFAVNFLWGDAVAVELFVIDAITVDLLMFDTVAV